ncbi:helix-turn-helix transcriptional regulator [Burkholderia dolosa]|uniref:helix-turn-helix transcriptional regulator n=1 Tax=Burkholderia dolosa TaxID=152500 RepID=UPI002010EA15|nr:AlpA family phage regulatory protein [Burkholderia dolosa]
MGMLAIRSVLTEDETHRDALHEKHALESSRLTGTDMKQGKNEPGVIAIPETGFMRHKQILQIFPVSRSTLWRLVQAGKFPKPIKMGAHLIVWRAEEVRAWIAAQGRDEIGIVSVSDVDQVKTKAKRRRSTAGQAAVAA